MATCKALVGHGIFTEFSVNNALTRFANYGMPPGSPPPNDAQRIASFIQALKDMEISTVWIQLFTRTGDVELLGGKDSRRLRTALIDGLQREKINWAGWGYCFGANNQRDIDEIRKLRDALQMKAFVIDAEPEQNRDDWTEGTFDSFTSSVNRMFGTDNVALSTWPILEFHDNPGNPVVKYMKIAATRVALFAPQAYWMDYPGDPHYNHFSFDKYPRSDPSSFVRLVIDAWNNYNFGRPIVISGQAYWHLNRLRANRGTPSQDSMGMKVCQVGRKFTDWEKIAGFNWYHAGTSNNSSLRGSMSDDMVANIANGRFGSKPYQQV
jgi:hypothetical protein